MPARDVVTIATLHGVLHIYQAALPPLYLLIQSEFKLSFAQIGLIGATTMGTNILQGAAGFLVDKFGRKNLALAGMLTYTAALTLLASSPTFLIFLILVFITGVGSSTFHPSTYSIVSEKMGREHLAKSLAFHQFGGFLGGAAGTVLVAYLGSLIGWRYALLALPVPGILIIAAFWVTVKEEPKELRTNPTEVLKGFPSENSEFKLTAALLLIILFSFFSVLGDVTSNFLPAFLGNVYGSSVVDAGALASILQFVGCVGLLAGGTVADKLDKVNLTSTSQFIFGALVVLLASTNLLPPLLVLTIAAVGFFKFFAGPSIHALTSLTTPARARGRAFGLTFAGISVGGALSSILTGYLVDLMGMRAAFIVVTSFSFLAGTMIQVLKAGRIRRNFPL